MISAPTLALKKLCLDQIEELRIADDSAKADVGADIIRPLS